MMIELHKNDIKNYMYLLRTNIIQLNFDLKREDIDQITKESFKEQQVANFKDWYRLNKILKSKNLEYYNTLGESELAQWIRHKALKELLND